MGPAGLLQRLGDERPHHVRFALVQHLLIADRTGGLAVPLPVGGEAQVCDALAGMLVEPCPDPSDPVSAASTALNDGHRQVIEEVAVQDAIDPIVVLPVPASADQHAAHAATGLTRWRWRRSPRRRLRRISWSSSDTIGRATDPGETAFGI